MHLRAFASSRPAAEAARRRRERADTGGIKIGLLLDDLRQERWQRDRDLFVSRAEELHAKVEVRTGEGNPERQLKAANELLDAGVKVLVVVPNDLEKAVAIVDAAAAKKVPVISYDRLIRDADVAMYVSFDNVKVGRMQAEALLNRAPRGNYVLLGGAQSDNNARLLRDGQMEVLKPAVASGAVKIVAEPWIDGWDEGVAKTQMAKHPQEDEERRRSRRVERQHRQGRDRRAHRGQARRQGRRSRVRMPSSARASASSRARRR